MILKVEVEWRKRKVAAQSDVRVGGELVHPLVLADHMLVSSFRTATPDLSNGSCKDQEVIPSADHDSLP